MCNSIGVLIRCMLRSITNVRIIHEDKRFSGMSLQRLLCSKHWQLVQKASTAS